MCKHLPGPPGRTGRPRRERWLLVRRSLFKSRELAYYMSNAAAETPMLTLAQVAASRYIVEQCLEEAKGEIGLDEYKVRNWPSWHRHITLSLMAPTWLAATRSWVGEKGGLVARTRRSEHIGSTPSARRGAAAASALIGATPRLITMAASQELACAARSLPLPSGHLGRPCLSR